MIVELTCGEVVTAENNNFSIRQLFGDQVLTVSQEVEISSLHPGDIVQFAAEQEPITEFQPLAQAGSAEASIYKLAGQFHCNPFFSADAQAEAQKILAEPNFEDPSLQDYREKAFCTIDGPDTRDLDQALCVERTGEGFVVLYALADAAYYVRPGTALFDEALKRGASFYLPGLMIPMLPRELCEGVISLNPKVNRRSVVFELTLDNQGQLVSTKITRALICSRERLAFSQVQDFLDGQQSLASADQQLQTSLQCFQDVGLLRLHLANEHHIARPRRTEIDVKLGDNGWVFVLLDNMRDSVELYNEQLSLLCNAAGAQLLVSGDSDQDAIQPIYKIHPEPLEVKLKGFELLLQTLVKERQLPPEIWLWHRGKTQNLADYLQSLPENGQDASVAKAIQRQAILLNNRSEFSSEPKQHYGVGADVYARFSSPMREIVGIFLHKELLEKFALQTPKSNEEKNDERLRQQIITVANRAHELQKQLTKEANRLAMDQFFEADLQFPQEQRPLHSGCLLGLSQDKLYVLLDEPTIEIKIYLQHLQTLWKIPLVIDAAQTALLHGVTKEPLMLLGDCLNIKILDRDLVKDRWIFQALRT